MHIIYIWLSLNLRITSNPSLKELYRMVEVGVFQGNLSRHIWQRSASLPGLVDFVALNFQLDAGECYCWNTRIYSILPTNTLNFDRHFSKRTKIGCFMSPAFLSLCLSPQWAVCFGFKIAKSAKLELSNEFVHSAHMLRQSENMTGSGVACSKSIQIATVVMTGDDNKYGIYV